MKLSTFSILIMAITMGACSGGKEKAVYEGQDVSGFAEIIRDKQTKRASVQINQPGEWRLYAGRSVDEIDMTQPVSYGRETGTFHLNVPDSVRSYFQLVTPNGKAILAERHLPMQGGFNFRDLGGFRTQDGRYTKWGKIFRSDDLHTLTQADLDYLASIPIVSVVDFRSQDEISSAPDRVPSTVKEDYPYMISPGNLTSSAADLSQFQNMNMDSVMMQINIMLVTDSASIGRYRDFFALLQDDSRVPLMFHCTAGKDRTGMAAALVLAALGVDEQTIMQDYLASNVYLQDKYGAYAAQYPELAPLFGVKAEYIQAGWQRIKSDYGSVEDFLTNALNVNIDKFREKYLY